MLPDTFPFFEIKEVGEAGKFVGVATQYGVEDLGGDIIEKGALTKSYAENPVVPILWQHDQREVIGSGRLKDWQGKSLIDGQLDLDDVTAQKAYSKLKNGLIKGLSIGFTTIKSNWEEVNVDGIRKFIRHITELKLWEVSIVTFPMLPSAQVTRVKTARDGSEFLEVARGWLELEAASPTRDPQRKADLTFVLTKGLALLSEQGTLPGAADAKGAANSAGEPLSKHSALIEKLLKERIPA